GDFPGAELSEGHRPCPRHRHIGNAESQRHVADVRLRVDPADSQTFDCGVHIMVVRRPCGPQYLQIVGPLKLTRGNSGEVRQERLVHGAGTLTTAYDERHRTRSEAEPIPGVLKVQARIGWRYRIAELED